MKKIFISISALFMVVVVTLLIVLSTVKKNVAIEYDTPSVVRVYNKSTSPTKNDGYTKTDEQFNIVLEKLNQMTNMSLINRLNKIKSLKSNIYIDTAETYSTWKTELKKDNLVIELDFDTEQDLVVYEDDHTRVLSYWCISYVIAETAGFTEIIVYYSTTNSSTARDDSYAKCTPIILKGYVTDIISYVNSLTN